MNEPEFSKKEIAELVEGAQKYLPPEDPRDNEELGPIDQPGSEEKS